jgi:ATP-binding cassette, subfamily B, bacterial CvaB/MchF/RaxB
MTALFQAGGRVPLLLQAEAAECGLACLAMVAGAFGLQTDLATLRRRFSLSIKGVTMADLVRMAEAMQLSARALRADLPEMQHLRTPCILHWDMNHFVVLVRLQRGVATVHDPALGLRRLPLAQLSAHFTGVALELEPAASFAPSVQKQSVSLRQVLGPVQGWRRSLAQIVLLAAALEFFVLLGPLFMQWAVDGVVLSADRDLLTTLTLGFALLVALQVLTGATRSWAVLLIAAQLNQHWVVRVFTHLMRLPMDWFEKRQVGDVWSRFGAVQQIQRTLTGSFAEALLDGALVLVTLLMMWAYSPRLASVALLAVLLYAALRWAVFGRLRRASEEALVREARQSSHFLETLRGMQTLKILGAEPARASHHASLVVDTTNAQMQLRRSELWVTSGNRLVFGLERVAVVTLGTLLVLDHVFSVGMLFAFMAWKETFAQRVSSLVDKVSELRMLKLHAERLADIVLAAPESGTQGVAVAGFSHPFGAARDSDSPAPPRIELRHVSFRYADGEPPILSDISLVIEPGESLAIVGPSGCGKSTLMKLLLGLHAPTSGEIWVGGEPLTRVGTRAWRETLGAVMQDDALFSGSVADNISFFDATPDIAWVRHCARLASVHDDIVAMPMGYHTLVGDMGSTGLSGGQRQRLLLARALYRRPQVLLLDEATSSLDVERERQVNQAIRQLSLTRVIVAHRPETVASASRVVALAGGRIAQDLRAVPSTGPGAGAAAAVAPPVAQALPRAN